MVPPNEDMAAGIHILADKYSQVVPVNGNYRRKVTKHGVQLPDVG